MSTKHGVIRNHHRKHNDRKFALCNLDLKASKVEYGNIESSTFVEPRYQDWSQTTSHQRGTSPYPRVAESSVRVEADNNLKARVFSATSCGCAKAFVTRRCEIFRLPQESGWLSGTVPMHEVPLQPRPHAEGLGCCPNTIYNDRKVLVSSISILL